MAHAVLPLPAERNGFVTFGSLHTLAKLNSDVIDLWCELLRRVRGSRLLILRHTIQGATRERFPKTFRERGINDSCVELRERTPGGYLRTYDEIDISLDAFPWSGHTTACESLWQGVPIITLQGQSHAGRMVASVLKMAGLADWIVSSKDVYLEVAKAMAGDSLRLSQLRKRLRPRVANSRLSDGSSLARELELAYRQMWERWVRPA